MDLARKGTWLLGSSVALALLVTPFALGAGEGKPLLLGKRNPPKKAAKKTTQVVAKTKKGTAYTLKLTNSGAGGAALAGCKSATTAAPCLRANNSGTGG